MNPQIQAPQQYQPYGAPGPASEPYSYQPFLSYLHPHQPQPPVQPYAQPPGLQPQQQPLAEPQLPLSQPQASLNQAPPAPQPPPAEYPLGIPLTHLTSEYPAKWTPNQVSILQRFMTTDPDFLRFSRLNKVTESTLRSFSLHNVYPLIGCSGLNNRVSSSGLDVLSILDTKIHRKLADVYKKFVKKKEFVDGGEDLNGVVRLRDGRVLQHGYPEIFPNSAYNHHGYPGAFDLMGGAQMNQLPGSYPWIQQPPSGAQQSYGVLQPSGATQPPAFQPLAPQPLAPQPLAPQPLAPQPLAPQPLAPQPLAPQSFVPQPLAQQPPPPQPPLSQPLAPQSFAPQPLAPQSFVPQPLAPQSFVPQPLAQQPPPPQPPLSQPLAPQSFVPQPLAPQSFVPQPLAQQPPPPQPPLSQPLAPQSFAPQPLTQQPLTQQPLTQQPLTQQPLTQQPLTQQPLTQQPLTQQPLTQQPLPSQPLAPQSFVTQPQLPYGISRRPPLGLQFAQQSQFIPSDLLSQSPPLPPNKPQRRTLPSQSQFIPSDLLLQSPPLPPNKPQRRTLPSQSRFSLSSILNQDPSSSSLQPFTSHPQQQQQQQQTLHLPIRNIPATITQTLKSASPNSGWDENQMKEYLMSSNLPVLEDVKGTGNGNGNIQIEKLRKIEELKAMKEAWVRLHTRLGKRPM